jgi:hypothetical protein
MLYEFIDANRDEIIRRCRAKVAERPIPSPTDVELEQGVPVWCRGTPLETMYHAAP